MNTLFLDAMDLNVDRNSDSESASVHWPMSIDPARRMSDGTVASTSASMESKPTYLAISASSSFVAELWRRSKLFVSWSDAGYGQHRSRGARTIGGTLVKSPRPRCVRSADKRTRSERAV